MLSKFKTTTVNVIVNVKIENLIEDLLYLKIGLVVEIVFICVKNKNIPNVELIVIKLKLVGIDHDVKYI